MKSKHEGFDSVKSKLVATAAGLFTVSGIHGTSLSDIASAADVAKGTLYYYYPAKDELVADVARSHGGWVADVILEWVESLERESEPEGSLLTLLDALTSDPVRRKLHVILFAESTLDYPMLASLLLEMSAKWSVMFEVGALKLRMPDARLVRSRSGVFFSMLIGYMCRADITDADKLEFIEVLTGK